MSPETYRRVLRIDLTISSDCKGYQEILIGAASRAAILKQQKAKNTVANWQCVLHISTGHDGRGVLRRLRLGSFALEELNGPKIAYTNVFSAGYNCFAIPYASGLPMLSINSIFCRPIWASGAVLAMRYSFVIGAWTSVKGLLYCLKLPYLSLEPAREYPKARRVVLTFRIFFQNACD